MPPAVLFGRSWHISTDDLVLPALVGVLFHGTWTALVAAEVAIMGLPDDCVHRALASSSIAWLLASFALTTVLQCVVAAVSMRGAMLEVHKRSAMPAALYSLLAAYVLEAAALVYATVVTFAVLGQQPHGCYSEEELTRSQQVFDLGINRWFLGTTWAALAIVGGLLVLLYNLYPDRSLEAWEKRVNCMSYVLCCRRSLAASPADGDDSGGGGNSSTPTVVRLARIFGDLLFPLNFSFTDTVAAITLVGITHRSNARGSGSSSHSHALIAAVGAGLFGAGRHEAVEGAGAVLEAAAAAAAAATPGGSADGKQHGSSGAVSRLGNAALASSDDAAVAAGEGSGSGRGGMRSSHAGSSSSGLASFALRFSSRNWSTPAEDVAADGGAAAGSGSSQPPQLAAVEGGGGSMVRVQSHHQMLQLLLVGKEQHQDGAAAGGHAAATTTTQATMLSSGSSLPHGALGSLDAATGAGLSSSPADGWQQRRRQGGSSPAPAGPASRSSSPGGLLPAARSSSTAAPAGSGSMWEMAVRQGSTLALAPGHVLSAAAGQQPDPERAGSLQLGLRSHSLQEGRSSGGGSLSLAGRTSSPVRGFCGSGASGQDVGSMPAGSACSQGGGTRGFSPLQPIYSVTHPQAALLQGGARHASSSGGGGGSSNLSPSVLGPVGSLLSPQTSAGGGPGTEAAGPIHPPAAALAPASDAAASRSISNVAAAAAAESQLQLAGSALLQPDGSPIPLELLEEALHWHHYANAIYGWPMFLWSHRYRVLRCCRLCCGGCCRPSDRSGGGAALASVSSGRPLAEGVDETSHTQQQPLLDVEQGGGSAAAAASGGAVADSGSGGGCSTSAGGSSSGSGCHVCARPLHAPDADAAVVRESDKDAGAAAGPAWLHQRLRLGNTWLWGQGAAAAAAGSTAASTAAPAIDGQVQQQPSVTTGLWSDEGGCSALCGGQWGESHVPKLPPLTASQRLTNEAIMQTARIPEAALLYVNYSNLVEGLLPYSVVLDEARRCVVVAIRGSLSVEDCVTDILYDPAPLDGDWLLQQPQQASAAEEDAPMAASIAAASAVDVRRPAESCALPSLAAEDTAAAAAAAEPAPVGVQLPPKAPAQRPGPAHAAPTAVQPAAQAASSSGGGTAASMTAQRSSSCKASPFASAAAAAYSAAGVQGAAPTALPLVVLPALPSVTSAAGVEAPVVPAAQQAAAAAAAAGTALAPGEGGQRLRAHFSLQHARARGHQQQQPSLALPELSQQPSVWQRLLGSAASKQQHRVSDASSSSAAASPRVRLLQLLRLQPSQAGASRLSLAGAASVQQMPAASAGGAAAGDASGGSRPQQRLTSSMSLNLGHFGRAGRTGEQQQRRRATTSSRMLTPQLLKSVASEHIHSSSSSAAASRHASAGVWLQGQMRRTTAADRALGAARLGHKFAPLTSPATDQSAAAAAASQRGLLSHQQQQQAPGTTRLHSRSSAPITRMPSLPAAGGLAAGLQAPAVRGGGGNAAAAAHDSSAIGVGGPVPLHSIRVDPGSAPDAPQQQRQQQQTLLQRSMSLSHALQSRLHGGSGVGFDSSQQPRRRRHASADGSSGDAGSGGRRSVLRDTASDLRRRLWLLPRSRTLSRHEDPHSFGEDVSPFAAVDADARSSNSSGYTGAVLADGGPTDWSLLSGAAPMTASRTAAVPHAAAGAAAAPGLLSHSNSMRVLPSLLEGGSSTGAEAMTACQPGGDGSASDETGTPRAAALAGGSSSVAALPTAAHHHYQQQLMAAAEGADTAAAAGGPTLADIEEAAEAAALEEAAEAEAAAAAAQAVAAEETPDTGAAGDQWFAHEGILNCARAIREDLQRLGLLDRLLLGDPGDSSSKDSSQHASTSAAGDGGGGAQHARDCPAAGGTAGAACSCATAAASKALPAAAAAAGSSASGAVTADGRWLRTADLPDCRGWTLVLTGHSLGAGVAALLALHYRARYGSVRAWCFAPPGGLLSPAAAASLSDICYSLVSAKDMIPRLSLWTTERLRDEMMLCALRCKMPKYKLLLGAVLGWQWTEHEVLRPLTELTEAQAAQFRAYRAAVEQERCLDPLRVRIAREFVPPGKVLWLERVKLLQPRLRVPAAAAAGAAADPASLHAVDSLAAAPDAVPGAQSGGGGSSSQQHTPGCRSAPPGPAAAAGPLRRGVSSGLQATGTARSRSAALEAAVVAASAAVAGKRLVLRQRPQLTDGLSLIVGGMVVSRNMFADHVPDKQLAQLKRLVRRLQRLQAAGGGARLQAEGVAPVVATRPPAQQPGMPPRRAA